jgi:hypothetical protein
MNPAEIWQLLIEAQQSISPPTPPEFRLYYDDNGKVITYSTEKIAGKKYIVITKEQYSESRPDVIVVNGKVLETHTTKTISRLTKNASVGTPCSKYDVNVIVDAGSDDCQYWRNEYYEL